MGVSSQEFYELMHWVFLNTEINIEKLNMKKVKLILLPLVIAFGTGVPSITMAASNNCATKRAAIEQQITEAEKYGNTDKVTRLKKALANIDTNCNDDQLIRDAQKKVNKLEQKLSKKQAEETKTQTDLHIAQSKDNSKKVTKYQKDLTKKQTEIQQIKTELRQAQTELADLQK